MVWFGLVCQQRAGFVGFVVFVGLVFGFSLLLNASFFFVSVLNAFEDGGLKSLLLWKVVKNSVQPVFV